MTFYIVIGSLLFLMFLAVILFCYRILRSPLSELRKENYNMDTVNEFRASHKSWVRADERHLIK